MNKLIQELEDRIKGMEMFILDLDIDAEHLRCCNTKLSILKEYLAFVEKVEENISRFDGFVSVSDAKELKERIFGSEEK